MFLFDLLFGNRKKTENAAATGATGKRPMNGPHGGSLNAPGTQIRHDPELIANLKDDHALLLEIFGAITAAANTGDYAQVEQRLGHFRTVLMDHLLKENVRLYVYLEHTLVNDASSHQLIREFRHEMDAIGRVVVDFLVKYKAIATQPGLAVGFTGELASIGEALVARIHREESTLYPMYTPPD